MKLRKLLTSVGGFVLLAYSVGANAIPFTYTDVFTPRISPRVFTAGMSPYSFQHNILNNGFDPLTETITAATLDLMVSNEAGTLPNDHFLLFLDGSFDSVQTVKLTDLIIDVDPTKIQTDGKLIVTLAFPANIFPHASFDFYMSTLQVSGDVNTASVPEPGIMLLLCSGLIVLWHVRNRSQRHAAECVS
jgi:hypothetical protein